MSESSALFVASTVPLTVRRFHPAGGISRHWLGGSALVTHAFNAMNLIFPDMELFFIHSVRRHRSHITDPEHRTLLASYIRQEAQHGASHRQALELLVAQGFALDGWMSRYRRGLDWFKSRAPALLCLSMTSAMEHFTARIAERWLTEGRLEQSDPEMAALLGWHAVEEIEHRAVAFDVLQAVDARWWVRAVGMLLVAGLLFPLWISGMVYLLRQDDQVSLRRLWREALIARGEGHGLTRFLRWDVIPYLRPRFHPHDHDNLHLAQVELDRLLGRLTAAGA